MRCPACDRDLTTRSAGGVAVDVCDGGCGGIWFDRAEFAKFDEPHEHAGEGLLDIATDGRPVDLDARRTCPRCGDMPMQRHFSSVERRVAVDECPQCGGVWLDTGELSAIRREYDSEEERDAAARTHYDALFDKDLATMRADTELDLARAKRVANALKYVCPSYYIPGKQDWGAF